jgi:hypothetical protein
MPGSWAARARVRPVFAVFRLLLAFPASKPARWYAARTSGQREKRPQRPQIITLKRGCVFRLLHII